MILALSFISPLFAAEKGDMEIVGKLGVAVNTTDVYVYEEYGDEVYNYEKNPALSIAVEGLYYLLPELPIGLGINYQFNSEKSKPVINSITSSSYESGSTNIYLTVKPTAKIDSKIFTALYAIGQIGFGLNRLDYSGWYLDDGDKIYYEEEVDSNGLYWGLGAGMEIIAVYRPLLEIDVVVSGRDEERIVDTASSYVQHAVRTGVVILRINQVA